MALKGQAENGEGILTPPTAARTRTNAAAVAESTHRARTWNALARDSVTQDGEAARSAPRLPCARRSLRRVVGGRYFGRSSSFLALTLVYTDASWVPAKTAALPDGGDVGREIISGENVKV